MSEPTGPATEPAGVWPTLQRGAWHAAPLLLGARLTVVRDGLPVTVRLTEVEAYEGQSDPGSHGYRGPTRRTATMYGPAGHAYCYFTYGMHWCVNLVCGPDGTCSAVLLRAGEVIDGLDTAVARRGARPGPKLASGPARLAQALGLGAGDDGAALLPGPGSATPGAGSGVDDRAPAEGIWLSGIRSRRRSGTATGPRTGVAGPGGGPEYPWRFWWPHEASVSPYRAATPRRRNRP